MKDILYMVRIIFTKIFNNKVLTVGMSTIVNR